MIIHYHNKTGKILNVISGRVHTDAQRRIEVGFSDIDPEDISCYEIPLNPLYEEDGKTVVEMRPTGPVADLLIAAELGNIDLMQCHLKINAQGDIYGWDNLVESQDVA